VVLPHAAGVDVGNGVHYVAVRPDRDSQPVRRFDCFTADLHRLADWLQSCGVKSLVLQSTGVYWIPLYDILEERGFEVYLVNARHTKNMPGRKSDVQESQWLLKLHTYGLLNNSFQPTSEIRVLRTDWRQRAEHARGIGTCILRMQKALTQMNLQLANVISDLSGVTGQKIVRAIVAGEAIRGSWLNSPIHGFTPARSRLPKAWKATGARICSLCCTRKSRCTQTLVSEVGLDMSRWKAEAHFASWLGFCPDNRISGDKVLSRGTRHVVNRAATSLRMVLIRRTN
jgi:hypothetical protein